eukprot:GHVS01018159.1.p3 GENE.GHVS01018159.1~~GHVS01018159.1.p3  ORF type:complete len:146 (+),score=15.18 GHVS01018159.1:492-929(+)
MSSSSAHPLHARGGPSLFCWAAKLAAAVAPSLLTCLSAGNIQELVRFGCFFSFSAQVFRNKKVLHLREVVDLMVALWQAQASLANVPKDRLLLETDSPDQPPCGVGVNYPKLLVEVCDKVGELLGISSEEVALTSYHNARKLFPL